MIILPYLKNSTLQVLQKGKNQKDKYVGNINHMIKFIDITSPQILIKVSNLRYDMYADGGNVVLKIADNK